MIITTTDYIPGYEITEIIRPVDTTAAKKSESLSETLERLGKECGADAIIDLKYCPIICGFVGNSSYIIAYGTMVKIKKL